MRAPVAARIAGYVRGNAGTHIGDRVKAGDVLTICGYPTWSAARPEVSFCEKALRSRPRDQTLAGCRRELETTKARSSAGRAQAGQASYTGESELRLEQP
jgi:hypothetical protein